MVWGKYLGSSSEVSMVAATAFSSGAESGSSSRPGAQRGPSSIPIAVAVAVAVLVPPPPPPVCPWAPLLRSLASELAALLEAAVGWDGGGEGGVRGLAEMTHSSMAVLVHPTCSASSGDSEIRRTYTNRQSLRTY